MAVNIKGIIIEIGGDTSNLQKALNKVNSITSSLNKELKGVNTLLKFDPNSIELTNQKQSILTRSIEETKQKIEQLKEIEKKADEARKNGQEISEENWRALQREIINTQNKLKNLLYEKNGWIVSGKNIESLGKKISETGNKLENLGSKLSKTLTTSILGIGIASSKSAVDFESAFAGVEKTIDGTAEQMENLKQGIKNMSKELPSTTTEISAVAEAAGQLGIQTDNVLAFSKTMIDMGNSTNLSADEAASSLARFANITQMSQKDFDKLGSSIVDLGNNFATTESEIVDMALRLAGAGHQVGMSEGQILGLATALSSVGIEAEMGGSALSKAMVKMQNAVEQGGTKLDALLNKTGMSLRDLELLSANNSKDFKALANSIGMTSTEVKQLITAGTNLEDFAKISGMSANEFKKAWKEDATGALTSFIKGLGNAESKGESAITMLSEMGLTEVRLRDSLLRAANAGNLFNSAIETGTRAWKDNVALANEANKRYTTTASKFQITLNKLQSAGTKLGERMLPIINKFLDKAEKWINKLDNVDDTTLDVIIKIGLLVTSLGPLIKILGTTTKVTGKGIEYFGKLTTKIGELDVASKVSTTTLGKFGSSLGSFVGQTSLVVAGTAAVVAGFVALDKKINSSIQESEKASDDLINSLQKTTESRKNNIEAINQQLDANLSEINNVEHLKGELEKLVDENGKVKDGYKERADFILNELNKSLGTEYKKTGNIIENYKEMSKAIDELIAKKRAQLIVEADEEKYKEAIKNKNQLYKDTLKTQDEIAKVEQRISEINSGLYLFEGSRIIDLNKAEKQYKELNTVLEQQNKQIKEYNFDILRYENNTKLVLRGGIDNYKLIEASYAQAYESISNQQEKNLNKQIENTQKSIDEQKKLYDIDIQNNYNKNESIYKDNIESYNKQLEQLGNTLVSMTSTVDELSPEIVQSWRNLAQNSRNVYNEKLSQLPKSMQEKINSIAGVVNEDVSVQNAVKYFGKKAVKELQIDSEFEEAGKNWIKGVTAGINNKLLRKKALSSMHGFGVEGLNAISQKAWDEHSPSKKTEKAAIYLLKGVSVGINKQKPKTINEMLSFGQELMSKFNSSTDLNLNSKFPEFNTGIKNSIDTALTPKILSPNITIYTQKLDNEEMNKIVDNVNRKFGIYFN